MTNIISRCNVLIGVPLLLECIDETTSQDIQDTDAIFKKILLVDD